MRVGPVCAGHASSGVFAESFDGGTGARGTQYQGAPGLEPDRAVKRIRRVGWHSASVVPGGPGQPSAASVVRATTTGSCLSSPRRSARSRTACSAGQIERTKFQVIALLAARGARAGEGRRVCDRRAARRAAEAAGRDRDDPRADRGPRAVAVRPARRGRRGQRLGATAQARDAGRRRAGARPGGRAAPAGRDRPAQRAAGRAAVGGRPRSWPTRSSRPTSPTPSQRRHQRAAPGRLGADRSRCSTRSRTPTPGAPSCMELPEPATSVRLPPGLELMPHQARLLAAAAGGHRTFLLADEPGLGKTAQALLAAQAADAYPLLCVVPSVVKTNWAREAALWTPSRSVTVIHGSGETIDGFADIVVVNYEVLDRHVGWIATHGFRGMVVDEAHFIKNKKSQRSQHVLEIADRIRQRIARPLMMALTGTPLINDIDDFRAIWQFLGWIGEKKPGPLLMAALEETGLTPDRPRLLPGGPPGRHRPRHRPAAQGRRGRRDPGPADRRPARRARPGRRPLHPRRRAGARAAAPPALRRRRGRPRASGSGQTGRGHRPRAGTRGRRLGAHGRRPSRPRARTSSRWSAGSATPRPPWPPTTPPSWPATPARWCSSPSTST